MKIFFSFFLSLFICFQSFSMRQHTSFINCCVRDNNGPLEPFRPDWTKNKVLQLIERGANLNQNYRFRHNPIFFAVKTQDFKLTNTLLEKGASIDVFDSSGDKPIHCADGYTVAQLIKGKFYKASVNSSEPIKIIKLLLEKGENIDAQNRLGQTILHKAVCVHNTKLVNFLLLNGASQNIRDINGDTPSDVAKKIVNDLEEPQKQNLKKIKHLLMKIS